MDKCYNCGSNDLNKLDSNMSHCNNCGVVFDPAAYRISFDPGSSNGSYTVKARFLQFWKQLIRFPNWRKEDYILAIAVTSLTLSICSTIVLSIMVVYLFLLYVQG